MSPPQTMLKQPQRHSNTPEPRDGETDTARRIRLRCIECGDCWLWQGATSTSEASRRPAMNHQGKVNSVRRVLAVDMGLQLLNGRRASNSCANSLCVSPDHLTEMTPAAVQRRTAELTGHQRRPTRNARMRDAHASKLTMELAREIRASPLTQQQAADHYGVSKVVIWRIRNHLSWREYETNPFAGLLAANDAKSRSRAC